MTPAEKALVRREAIRAARNAFAAEQAEWQAREDAEHAAIVRRQRALAAEVMPEADRVALMARVDAIKARSGTA